MSRGTDKLLHPRGVSLHSRTEGAVLQVRDVSCKKMEIMVTKKEGEGEIKVRSLAEENDNENR